MFLPPTGTPDALLLPDPIRVRDLTEWLGSTGCAPSADELSAARLRAEELHVSARGAGDDGALAGLGAEAGRAR